MIESTSAERGAEVRFPPPLVFLGTTLLGVALQSAGPDLSLPLDRWIGLGAGLLLLLAGLALGTAAHARFRRTGQHPAPWRPSPEFIRGGPYRFTRNPMYVGMSLIEIGLGLAVDNLWIVLLTAPALLAVHFIAVRPEERYLATKFGKPYVDYVASVRRYL